MPASRITGTSTPCRISRMWCGLRMPSPEPIGAPAGITAAQPDVGQPAGEHRVVAGVRQHGEPVGDQLLGGAQQLHPVGQQRPLVADHLQLDPVGVERLPGQVGPPSPPRRRCSSRRCSAAAARRSGPAAPAARRRAGAVSTRRSATVTSSVPEARIACSSTCRLAAPPVPRISREVNVSPPSSKRHAAHPPCAAVSTSTRSPSRSARGRPAGPGHHLAVDRDRDPRGCARCRGPGRPPTRRGDAAPGPVHRHSTVPVRRRSVRTRDLRGRRSGRREGREQRVGVRR